MFVITRFIRVIRHKTILYRLCSQIRSDGARKRFTEAMRRSPSLLKIIPTPASDQKVIFRGTLIFWLDFDINFI
jgi:hypothetical protein